MSTAIVVFSYYVPTYHYNKKSSWCIIDKKKLRQGVTMAGKIKITLEEYRLEKGISKYKICQACNLQPRQLNAYCNNKISRVDLDVLTRICGYLECDLSDILKYTSEKKSKKTD